MQPLLASSHLRAQAAAVVSLPRKLDALVLSIKARRRGDTEKPHSNTNVGKKLVASEHETTHVQMPIEKQDASQILQQQ